MNIDIAVIPWYLNANIIWASFIPILLVAVGFALFTNPVEDFSDAIHGRCRNTTQTVLSLIPLIVVIFTFLWFIIYTLTPVKYMMTTPEEQNLIKIEQTYNIDIQEDLFPTYKQATAHVDNDLHIVEKISDTETKITTVKGIYVDENHIALAKTINDNNAETYITLTKDDIEKGNY